MPHKGEFPVLNASPRKTLYFTYLFLTLEAAHSFVDWDLFFYLIFFLLLYFFHYHLPPLNLPHLPFTAITTLKVFKKNTNWQSSITYKAGGKTTGHHQEAPRTENYGKGDKERESSTLTPFIVIQLESVRTSAIIGPFGINAASSLAHALVFQAFINIYKSIFKIEKIK